MYHGRLERVRRFTFYQFTYMKKIFLPVLAFVGMGLGVALTSCGGGGGGAKVAGTTIMANSVKSNVAYRIFIADPLGDGAAGAYYGSISDEAGFRTSQIMYSLRDIKTNGKNGLLSSCTGSIASVTFEQSNMVALFRIVWGLDLSNSKVTNIDVRSGPEFVLEAEDIANATITWSGEAEYQVASSTASGVTGNKVDVNLDCTEYVLRISRD